MIFLAASAGKTGDAGLSAKKALNRIGFSEEMWTQEAACLSGGEKTKLSLCRAMVADFDFLLLDDPSNHLIWKAVTGWRNISRAWINRFLIISHDRYLLDTVANKIWELTPRVKTL